MWWAHTWFIGPCGLTWHGGYTATCHGMGIVPRLPFTLQFRTLQTHSTPHRTKQSTIEITDRRCNMMQSLSTGWCLAGLPPFTPSRVMTACNEPPVNHIPQPTLFTGRHWLTVYNPHMTPAIMFTILIYKSWPPAYPQAMVTETHCLSEITNSRGPPHL